MIQYIRSTTNVTVGFIGTASPLLLLYALLMLSLLVYVTVGDAIYLIIIAAGVTGLGILLFILIILLLYFSMIQGHILLLYSFVIPALVFIDQYDLRY